MPRNKENAIQKISVIVPVNPFAPDSLKTIHHCLSALNVNNLMDWWPGRPHLPHRNASKVRDIQRSLDWKRVAHIASYLLQQEIVNAPGLIEEFFSVIYEPRSSEPGREWPPKVPNVVGYQRSEYPTFSNVLLHVNGAKVVKLDGSDAAHLTFDQNSPDLNFSVIDGQHRINGAYFAVMIKRKFKNDPNIIWEIPSEIFLDLDKKNDPPRRQAQIFIDVNFNQKKVDKSLVADLFPTARGPRGPLDNKERAQDLGRKLMLDIGPLVGMIQIPGIKFGVKGVVTLATLNSAIENVLPYLNSAGIESLDEQADFLAQCLDSWLNATGRKEEVTATTSLHPQSVVYQGRVLVSFLSIVPACIWQLKEKDMKYVSDESAMELEKWLKLVAKRANLLNTNGQFIDKEQFKTLGYLGSGGIGRFRDALWASTLTNFSIATKTADQISVQANKNKSKVFSEIQNVDD
jgi:DGQHR domain-containing protein